MAPAQTILNINVASKIVQSIIEELSIEQPNIDVEEGSNKGDGYMSSITKVKVGSKEPKKDLSLIIKMAPNNETYKNSPLLRSSFKREIYFYNTIVKAFEDFQMERGVSDMIKVPKCFKTSDDSGNEFLVLRNIRTQGHDMWNRTAQLDEDHVIIGLKHYAKLHALSYAMKNLDSDLFEKITKNLDCPIKEEYSKYISNVKSLCDSCFTKDGDKEIYGTIQKYLDGLKDFVEVMKHDKGKNSVILHGDCWSSNMVYRYEFVNGDIKPVEVHFLDFQLSFFGSAAVDLSYFLFVSSPKEILDKYKHYLGIYHDELKKSCEELGGSPNHIPSKTELEEEFRRYAKHGFTMALFIFRAMLCEEEEVLSYNDLAKKNIPIEDMFINRTLNKEKEVKQLTKTLALFMQKNNLF